MRKNSLIVLIRNEKRKEEQKILANESAEDWQFFRIVFCLVINHPVFNWTASIFQLKMVEFKEQS